MIQFTVTFDKTVNWSLARSKLYILIEKGRDCPAAYISNCVFWGAKVAKKAGIASFASYTQVNRTVRL